MSVAMLILNPAIGWMYDWFGGIKGNLVICLFCALGTFLLVLCGGSSKPLFYMGVACYNLVMSSITLGIWALVKYVFGVRAYAQILSKVSLVFSLKCGGGGNGSDDRCSGKQIEKENVKFFYAFFCAAIHSRIVTGLPSMVTGDPS